MFRKKNENDVISMVEENTENDIIIENDDSKTGPEVKPKKGQFTKGYDPRRNIAGRPPSGKAFAEKTRDILKSPSEINPDLLVEDVILMQLVHDAQDGSLNAVQILLNRAYGNTRQDISVEVIPEETTDFSKFSDEELYLYLSLAEKAENGLTPKYYFYLEKSKGRTDEYELTKEIEEKYGKIE